MFTCPLLGSGSLPPDFANRCVKSLAVVLTRCLQVFCSVAAHFRQILPARCVKSLALVLAHYFQAFGLVRITSARLCQQMCEIPSRRFNTVLTGPLLGRDSLPPDFCQQMCEIPSRRFNTVFTGPLLGRGSLPPDFASQMCAIARRRVNTVFAGLLLGRGSLPPDFANRCVKSLTRVFMRYLQAFCLVML